MFNVSLRRLPFACRAQNRLSLFTLLLLGSFVTFCVATVQAQSSTSTSAPCNPVGNGSAFCSATNVEDLAPLYPSPWIFGSSLAAPGEVSPVVLYLFNAQAQTVEQIQAGSIPTALNATLFPTCPGAPDFTIFDSHGLNFAPSSANGGTLYVINHGGRETVEAFSVTNISAHPQLTWIGCVPALPNTFQDAVAALPDGGLDVTSLWNPNDPNHVAELEAGEPVGAVNEWHASTGWAPLPGTNGVSGPNGIIASPDGGHVFIALSGTKQVLSVTRGANVQTQLVSTQFTPDNVRWAPGFRSFFVGGEATDATTVLNCFLSDATDCPIGIWVDAVNPQSLQLTPVVPPGTIGAFGDGTGAIQEGSSLWLSSFRNDSVAVVPF